MKIIIAGGSGWLGRAFSEAVKKSHPSAQISLISRTPGESRLTWDQIREKGLPSDTNILLNMCGVNLFSQRWTPSFKEEIVSSRVIPGKILRDSIIDLEQRTPDHQLQLFITASGSAFSPSSREVYDETSDFGSDFLGSLCTQIEESNQLPKASRVRQLICRLPMILGPSDGGALQKMLPIFRLGIGGSLGSGSQLLSWIHRDDLMSIWIKAVEDQRFKGILNCVTPQVISNQQLTTSLANAVHRPAFFWTPEWACKALFGEAATLLLDSRNVVSNKLQKELNFRCKFGDIDSALKDLI